MSNNYGLFWTPDSTTQTARRVPTPGNIPDTGWCAPAEFPRLESAKQIVIDVETYDPHIDTHGPGWATGDGHIVGLAVGTEDQQWYFPMRHEYGGGNMDTNMVLRWARDELTRPTQPKIGTNIMYDIGWLGAEGVDVQGDFIDVAFAEALLDEHAFSYALSAMAHKHQVEGKDEDALYEWLYHAYGGTKGRWQARNIYRAPAQLVGPYAESDVRVPLALLARQRALLESEELLDVFQMECDLIPQLIAMRRQGVRVDVAGAERTREDFIRRECDLQTTLDALSGRHNFNPDAPTDMVAAFDALGIPYPKTAKGNPSFAKGFIESLDHPIAKAILDKRRIATARRTFIEGYLLDKGHNGRIHAEFHPLKRDDGGTVSGRFSSSNPNLQNIPKRDKEMKRLIRGLFLPEEGCEWFAPDYSQIEYRVLAHFAIGDGAEVARQRYRDDPNTDYHEYAHDLIQEITSKDYARGGVKGINFGIVFGMGEPRIISILGSGGAEVLNAYHTALPFVKRTLDVASQRAQNRGFIRTLGGRKARFPFWECAQYYDAAAKAAKVKEDPNFFKYVMSHEVAIEKWGRTKRARTHKSLNCLTQGSGADIIKKAMVAIWKAGLPVPLVQVHDELGFSLQPVEQKEVANEIVYVMENTTKMKVPVRVSPAWGKTWGDC